MRVAITVPSLLLGTALLAAGCATSAGPPTPAATGADATAGTGTATAAGTTAPAATPGGTTDPAFTPTDVAWLQLTVAMAERLLPVLALAPERTSDPAWRRLAAGVADAHRTDLARARRLLAESGAPESNPHEGHDMPGMVTAEQLTALRAATGARFERLVGEHLRAHLTQAVRIARAEQQGGGNPAATGLAARVVRDGTAELARLDRLAPAPATTPTG
ncbi:DUF305 domain-containing protein [Micromonospora krabiensis]|uniref:DUF305 domain-containing protein n=1 Tax=Micromonospora krabiensis TaxID=307121 RepID=UPI0012FE0C6E|nr:DUF305 domain-containing protein [Micromonospora krabiensis]